MIESFLTDTHCIVNRVWKMLVQGCINIFKKKKRDIRHKIFISSKFSDTATQLLINLFMKWLQCSMDPAGVVNTGGKLPLMLLTPVANLQLVSTTLAKLVAKFAAGVAAKSGKFAASVVDTSGNFATRVIDTRGAP